MEFDIKPYGVYVKTDEEQRITAINSSAFLLDTDGWTLIDTGVGDKYHHAQGNYLDKPLMDERGVLRYKLEGGKVAERTQTEMDADYIPYEEHPDTDNNDLATQVAELKKQVDEQASLIASYEAAYKEGVQNA